MTEPGHDRRDRSWRLLFVLGLTISLTVLGTGLVATLAWHLAAPIKIDDAFISRVTTPRIDFYAGQPRKNAAFEAGCLSAPFFLILGNLASGFILGRLPHAVLPRLLGMGAGLYGLLFFWCLFPMVYCPAPPYPDLPPRWLLFPQLVGSNHLIRLPALALGVGLCLFFCRCPSSRQYWNFAGALLIVAWFVLIPTHFYAPAEVCDDVRFAFHFNALNDALSQAANGRHFLVDFPHAYGGYVEFLGPVVALFPRHIEVLLLVFGLLKGFALLCLLLTARLLLRRPLLLFLTGTALIGVECINSANEHYYQYSAIRLLFPAMGLYLSALYFRHPGWFKYALLTLLVSIASIWNLDTGSILWLAWTATLIARAAALRSIAGAFWHLAAQLTALALSWGFFLIYLRLVSGSWPDPSRIFFFQKFFAGAGYFCVALLIPDIWIIVLTIYAIGLGTAVVFYFRKAFSWQTHFIFMLSLLGLGLFTYFLGRSVESNLVSCSYPIILLIGILLEQTQSLVARQGLPRLAWGFLAPPVIILGWWACLTMLAVPSLLRVDASIVHKWTLSPHTPVQINGEFIQALTVPHEKVYILSRQSGFYYYLSDTVCPFEIPGTLELFSAKDLDIVLTAIRSEQLPKLFVDQDFFDSWSYRPEVVAQIKQALSEHYLPAKTSPDGALTLYLPK